MKSQMGKAALTMLLAAAVIMTPVGVYAENVESPKNVEVEVQYVSSEGNEIIANDDSGIPDTAFYKAVLKLADKDGNGQLTQSEAKEVTELSLNWREIKSIKGIEFLSNLETLRLGSNSISDISALSSLTKLEELVLSFNNISDISALSNLTNLTSNLYLDNNNISDISALSSLTNLTRLTLDSNSISNISALSSLTNLTHLYLNSNSISDISALGSLTNLTHLGLGSNSISDISALGSLTNLEWLRLNSNSISDISALSSLTNLTELYLDNNNISDISVLSDLTKLKKVSYENNPISSNPVSPDPVSPDPVSSETVRNFVSRLYALVLGREAEESELDSWAQVLLEKKSSGVDAGYGFVFSDECKNRNLSNEDFVEILYKTFMDRPSDEGGKSAWVSQLEAGVEREKVFEGLVYSTEFAEICAEYGINVGSTGDVDALAGKLGHYRNQNADITKFVARCYTEALGRVYEPAGLEDWCRVIINQENTPKQVAQNFIFSNEFVQKDLSNEEYVKVLYRTFMGREADEGGLTAWVAVLESGKEDRKKVLEGFSDSVEFAGILQSFGLN